MAVTVYDLSGCSCCGTGTGTATNVNTECCVGYPIPQTLYASITWDTVVYFSTITLVYDAGLDKWVGTGSCNAGVVTVHMFCRDVDEVGNWVMYASLFCGGDPTDWFESSPGVFGGGTIISCSPFQANFLKVDLTELNTCCGGVGVVGRFEMTVTE